MRHSQFFSILDDLPPVLLFSGDEEYVKDDALRALRNAVLKGGLPELNETAASGAQDFQAVKALCETMPFMGDRRLVILRDSAFFQPKANSDELIEYLKTMPDYTFLLFFERGAVDKSGKLAKYLFANDLVVEFSELSLDELSAWANKKAADRGKSITRVAISSLIMMAGTRLDRLENEMEKLLSYCEDKPSIIDRDVEAVVTPTMDYSVFRATDALIAGKHKVALEVLKSLFDQGEDVSRITSGITATFRRLFQAKSLAEGGKSQAEIAGLLGINQSWAGRILGSARKISADRLKNALEIAGSIEQNIRINQEAPELALYSAVFGIKSALAT